MKEFFLRIFSWIFLSENNLKGINLVRRQMGHAAAVDAVAKTDIPFVT
jgi:hypothetical protein